MLTGLLLVFTKIFSTCQKKHIICYGNRHNFYTHLVTQNYASIFKTVNHSSFFMKCAPLNTRTKYCLPIISTNVEIYNYNMQTDMGTFLTTICNIELPLSPKTALDNPFAFLV